MQRVKYCKDLEQLKTLYFPLLIPEVGDVMVMRLS